MSNSLRLPASRCFVQYHHREIIHRGISKDPSDGISILHPLADFSVRSNTWFKTRNSNP